MIPCTPEVIELLNAAAYAAGVLEAHGSTTSDRASQRLMEVLRTTIIDQLVPPTEAPPPVAHGEARGFTQDLHWLLDRAAPNAGLNDAERRTFYRVIEALRLRLGEERVILVRKDPTD